MIDGKTPSWAVRDSTAQKGVFVVHFLCLKNFVFRDFLCLKISFFQVVQNIEGFCLGIYQAAVLYVFHKAVKGMKKAWLIECQGKCGIVLQPQIQDDSGR